MNANCPPEERITEYLEGLLSDADQERLESHIADCGFCLDTIAEGSRLLRGGSDADYAPVPAHVTRSAIDAIQQQRAGGIANRIKNSAKTLLARIGDAVLISPAGTLHPAAIRGSLEKLDDDRVLLKKTFSEIDAEIEIERSAGGTAHIRVRLSGASRSDSGVRVSLQKSDRELSSQLLGGGDVVFEDVPYDGYRMVFSRNGGSLGAFSFEIKETMND